jgi:hypothetical protein
VRLGHSSRKWIRIVIGGHQFIFTIVGLIHSPAAATAAIINLHIISEKILSVTITPNRVSKPIIEMGLIVDVFILSVTREWSFCLVYCVQGITSFERD